MRSIRLLAATTVIALGLAACGGDNGGGVEPGTDPEANFTPPTCTVNVPCLFTDASSDDGTITAWTWNFGDGATATTQNPSHTFAAAGSPTVTLTVTDDQGNTDTHSEVVSVTEGTPTNVAPTAGFTVPSCVVNVACLFTDTSTDTDGQVTGWSWNFGDGTAAVLEQNPSHTYAVEGNYNVELTVTDDDGATDIIMQVVTVAPPAAQSCTGTSATDVTCTITLAQRSIVTITLQAENCEIGGNTVLIPPPEPRAQSVFFNVCNQTTPQTRTLIDDAGAEMVFEAGTQLPIVFRRGSDPVAVAPQAQLASNSASSWTINVDDGGNPGGPGEPDFEDVVLEVTATAR